MNGARPGPLVLGRYGADELLAMFAEAGVLTAIQKRGFCRAAFELDGAGGPLVHARLLASKQGRRHQLVDACLTRLHLEAGDPAIHGRDGGDALDLAVVYWLRQQDPTADFDSRHPRLPLQQHPGLGVLRQAFQVAVRMGRELGEDGIAALPKFFHDAAIFYRSRLFLFLDPREQGQLEALLRDLAPLSLADATMAFLGDAVRDGEGRVVCWRPALQILPLSARLTERFHSAAYQAACTDALENSHFTWDPGALAAARSVFEAETLREQAAC